VAALYTVKESTVSATEEAVCVPEKQVEGKKSDEGNIKMCHS
jgi:hypothetical protein